MRSTIWIMGCAAVLLTACEDSAGGSANAPAPVIAELPESVAAIVASGQDLTSVQIDPIDGCYVYTHAGPVETTLLPLRAKNGRPLCTRAAL